MAAPNRILALNIGTQTISLAEFQINTGGGLVLSRFQQGEILGDPAADSSRVAQGKLEIQSLVSSWGLKGGKVNYAIASNVIFIRPVTLPSVGEQAQVEQIIGFEAQQNVPYPIDQVVWDWQLLDDGSDGSVEVILAAIKSDLLDEISDGVGNSGLDAGTIEIAPMALYNTFRYNYSEAEGCSLIVDIGSRTTNLIFVEPGKIFPRRLNLGGSSITTAIAKDLGISFAEADARKAEEGFVSLGGGYAEPDNPDLARMSKIIRNQMTRLHQEIARSITFYRSEHSGSQPVRVLLAGGTASFPYMREFFQEKFSGMEVEYFNPLRNVAVAQGLDIEEIGRKAHTLGELVGLALRSAGSCPMELSLRPQSVLRAEQRAAQKPFIIAAGVGILATIGAFYLYYGKAAALADAKKSEVEAKVSTLSPKKSALDSAAREIKNSVENSQAYLTLVDERGYWVNVLNDINSRLPQRHIWLTAFETPNKQQVEKMLKPTEPVSTKPGAKKKTTEEPAAPTVEIIIKGLVLENPKGLGPLDEFEENLAKSEWVALPTQSERKIREQLKATDWAAPFEMPLTLKKPINLK